MTTRMKLTIVLCAVVIGIIAVLLIKPPPLKVRHPVKLETRVFKLDAHLFSTNAVLPQIHIKARFIEVPKDGFVMPQLSSNAVTGQMTGILSDPEFRTVLGTVEHQKGAETLAEPECITTS